MNEQTEFDAAQIRAVSVQVEQVAREIALRAGILHEKFNELYCNWHYADPVHDVPFEHYMLALARAKFLCDEACALTQQAKEMQRYGLPVPTGNESKDCYDYGEIPSMAWL